MHCRLDAVRRLQWILVFPDMDQLPTPEEPLQAFLEIKDVNGRLSIGRMICGMSASSSDSQVASFWRAGVTSIVAHGDCRISFGLFR